MSFGAMKAGAVNFLPGPTAIKNHRRHWDRNERDPERALRPYR
jgi:hypothetical protein